MTFLIESIQPADTSADLRAAVRHFRDTGALPAGVTLDGLRTLATHARRLRISEATRGALGLGDRADGLDLVDAIGRATRKSSAAEQGVVVIDARSDHPRTYADDAEAQRAEKAIDRRRAVAIDRAAAPATETASPAPEETESTKPNKRGFRATKGN